MFPVKIGDIFCKAFSVQQLCVIKKIGVGLGSSAVN